MKVRRPELRPRPSAMMSLARFRGSRRRAFGIGLASLGLLVVLGVVAVDRLRATGNVTALDVVPPDSLREVPPFSHVYLIVLENESFDEIVGNGNAPFLNELIDRYGFAAAYQAVAHPSQPNYLALVSGSTQDVTDDELHDLTAPTVFDQLEQAGRSWRVYAENVPSGCYRGATATGGPDGRGTYTRKHEPAISFTSISGDPARCANIQDLASFDPAAADLELIIPDACHDMHDCPVGTGDAWLRSFVPRILASRDFASSGALFITFDEGTKSEHDTNHVATIVAGAGTPPGFRSTVSHNHYSLLRTIQEAWALPCLAATCDANTLGEFFPEAALRTGR